MNTVTLNTGRSKLTSDIYRNRYLYLLILPSLVFFLVFSYAPMYGIILAFKKFRYDTGISHSPWVGLENFRTILHTRDFWRAMRNTVIISAGKIVFVFPIPIIMALFLNELKNDRFKRVTQLVLYLPHFLSWIVIAGLIFNLFSVTNGVVSKVLVGVFDIDPIRVIGNPKFFRPLIYLSDIWKDAGWGTIIYLAALSGVDPNLYEAAEIDGAGRFQKIFFITIPSLSFAIAVTFILQIGNMMNAGFDQIFNLYDPSVYNVGDIVDTYVYRIGIQNARFEQSTAIGLFKAVINAGMLLLANWGTKRMGQEGLY